MLLGLSVHAKTYYYKIDKIVTNGVSRTASGSGIFITFTSQGCYDSDWQGYTNNKSNLQFAYERNYKVYNGITYWGKGDYRFNADLSRLNIVVGDVVYVYNKVSRPTGINNSTYVGPEKPSVEGRGGYIAPIHKGNSNTLPADESMSIEWYQGTYNRYASNAEAIYKSITTKFVDSSGNEMSGYVYKQQDSQIAINSMISNLRAVQRDMRDLRQEAARHGYTLVKSQYETISVKRL